MRLVKSQMARLVVPPWMDMDIKTKAWHAGTAAQLIQRIWYTIEKPTTSTDSSFLPTPYTPPLLTRLPPQMRTVFGAIIVVVVLILL